MGSRGFTEQCTRRLLFSGRGTPENTMERLIRGKVSHRLTRRVVRRVSFSPYSKVETIVSEGCGGVGSRGVEQETITTLRELKCK